LAHTPLYAEVCPADEVLQAASGYAAACALTRPATASRW
jgi:hypothetical protein